MHATITGGTITTDNVSSVTFTTPILDYLGDPLFCKILVSDSTLVVLIDKDGPSALGPFTLLRPATHATVMVKSQASINTWGGELATPYNGDELAFTVQTSPDLRYASFAIAPSGIVQANLPPPVPQAVPQAVPVTAGRAVTGADVPADGSNDASLGYIAIEVDGQPGTLQLFYLDNPPTITNYQRLTTAVIVPPGQPLGSIGGPMGIELTS
jgi:hypothetical protein